MLVSFSELLPFAHGLGRFFAGPLPNWPKASRGRGPSEGKSACCWSWVSHGVVIDTDILIYSILIPKWSLHRVWVFKRLYVYDSVCLFYFACILGLRKLTYSLEYSMLPKEHAFITGIPFWEVRVRADASCYVGVCTFVVVYVCRYMYIWALIYIYTCISCISYEYLTHAIAHGRLKHNIQRPHKSLANISWTYSKL